MNKLLMIGAGIVVVVLVAAGTVTYMKLSHLKVAGSPSPSPTASGSAGSMKASPNPNPTNTPMQTVAGLPRCSANDLTLSLGQQQGAAGTLYTPLVWTNKTSKSCTVYGYPAVALYDSNGKPVGKPASNDTSKTPSLTTVAAGKTVHATVGTHDPGNYPAGTCTGLSFKVHATLPGDTAYQTATFEETYCGTWLVSPMAAGSTD